MDKMEEMLAAQTAAIKQLEETLAAQTSVIKAMQGVLETQSAGINETQTASQRCWMLAIKDMQKIAENVAEMQKTLVAWNDWWAA